MKMTKLVVDAVWVSASQALQVFHEPILNSLSQEQTVACWQYSHTPDEAISLDIGIELLRDYLKSQEEPLHLIGHSTGGLLALLYARKYPQKVRSLTLLGVGVHPAVDWQAHFYTLLELIPCNRQIILSQMVKNVFGSQSKLQKQRVIEILDRDLGDSLSPHTLWQRVSIAPGSAAVPMLVGGSKDDVIVDTHSLHGWSSCLKPGDRLWQYHDGGHFFHYYHPEIVAKEVLEFWKLQPQTTTDRLPTDSFLYN
jgi:pimeloyl-ACP methyl ester carboxylesterase